MLTDSQIAQFRRDGYLAGPKVITDEQVELLRADVERVIRDKDNASAPQPVLCHNMGKPDAPIWQIVNIWEASSPFRELIHNTTIGEEMAQLTGANELRIWHDQIQFKPASTGGVNMWHQDAPIWAIIAPMTEVTAWVALDDVDIENGCMSMVPGSHLWGNTMDLLRTFKQFSDMPAEWNGHKVVVRPCPVRKGEVHYHHGLTWHGSSANISGRSRRAIALHFMTDKTRYVASGKHTMKQFVEVEDGQVMKGKHFPLVWSRATASAGV
jgi:ectoine hydroxylase-related dioxygenase (phytanoyl-CoA dioxygenase family)